MSSELFEQPAVDLVVRNMDPREMLATAVDKGLDPAALESLKNLYEWWDNKEAERAFNQAMHAAQQEMPTVVRDAENPKTHSKYAKLETVLKLCKPISLKHGFSLSYGEADCKIERHKKTVCEVRHTGGHVQKYELILPVDGVGPQGNPIGGMNAVQGEVSTMSYSKRVLFCQVFDLVLADTDKDGNKPSDTISETDFKALEKLLMESGSDIKKFCEVYLIDKVADLPRAQLGQARAQILRKMGKA